jgi:hypothetical protein
LCEDLQADGVYVLHAVRFDEKAVPRSGPKVEEADAVWLRRLWLDGPRNRVSESDMASSIHKPAFDLLQAPDSDRRKEKQDKKSPALVHS